MREKWNLKNGQSRVIRCGLFAAERLRHHCRRVNAEPVSGKRPGGAQFVISDNHGVVSARGVTPQRVTLPKSDNRYFGKLTYNVTFLHAGYYPTLVPLQTRTTHWYTFGNLLFLGVPGWFLVDPFNGGMYDIYPQRVNALMQPCPRGPWRDTCE